ncbi:hypothetical protein NLI96_g7923 [Meripilus lineatus]|uniref:Autophagy-related protein 14 n=1 Tax=Meripilus lineatus TaxID=2056292 RepID=A0AAD5YGS3_9APHY|nr:hypothetical protein NLI96_g7923 [Physisporinus lineatus]
MHIFNSQWPSLLAFRVQHDHAKTDRDTHIANANKSLASTVEPARLRRADLKCMEEKVREIWDGLEKVRKANEKSREKLRNLRETLANRKTMLSVAAATSPYPHVHPHPPSSSLATTSNTQTPQTFRPFRSRRLSGTSSSAPHTPSPTRPVPGSRVVHPFPSASPIPQSIRPQLSTPIPSTHTPSRPSLSPTSGTPFKFRRLSDGTLVPVDKIGLDANFARHIEAATFQLNVLSDTLSKARSGLVQELVEVFSVVEVGGRPPLGGKAGTKGEWTIGGLVLPVPGDMRRYPPDHINAVLTHTIHFLSLLAFYLGIKLPFDVVWSRSSTPPPSIYSFNAHSNSGVAEDARASGLLGVGTPWIGAIRGNEYGGWARWSTKHPLHVSATPPAPPASTSTSLTSPTSSQPRAPTSKDPPVPQKSTSRRASAFNLLPSHIPGFGLGSSSSPKRIRTTSTPIPPSPSPPLQMSSSSILAESTYEEYPTTSEPHSVSTGATPNSTSSANASTPNSSFTTALTMLLYNVCYLAYTQSVDIPLAQAGEVLGNLKSHATNPHLPAPTPPSFQLDFAQLLQATASNPSRARARGFPGSGVTGKVERGKDKTKPKLGERETIPEEEEGWDLVDADEE